MPGNWHVRFGRAARENDPAKAENRVPGRLAHTGRLASRAHPDRTGVDHPTRLPIHPHPRTHRRTRTHPLLKTITPSRHTPPQCSATSGRPGSLITKAV
jgi:hypothetical protein